MTKPVNYCRLSILSFSNKLDLSSGLKGRNLLLTFFPSGKISFESDVYLKNLAWVFRFVFNRDKHIVLLSFIAEPEWREKIRFNWFSFNVYTTDEKIVKYFEILGLSWNNNISIWHRAYGHLRFDRLMKKKLLETSAINPKSAWILTRNMFWKFLEKI